MASLLHIDWASKDCGKLEMSDKMPTNLTQILSGKKNKKDKMPVGSAQKRRKQFIWQKRLKDRTKDKMPIDSTQKSKGL